MDLNIVEDADEDDQSVLLVAGSLDLESRSALLTSGVESLERDDVDGLILDVGGVTFLDSSGIGVFVQLSQEAEDREKSFALRNPSARVQRVLEIAGLANTWIEPDGPSA
jgi:anti-anti-sigma factor